MPQEFHILKCYQCHVFQVHQVKKANKWSCKMCGEKQSLKKVYFVGTGSDCRHNVQKLNMMQKGSDEKVFESDATQPTDDHSTTGFCQDFRTTNQEHSVLVSSTKWEKYKDTGIEEEEECDMPQGLENCVLTTQVDRGRKRKRNADKPSHSGKPRTPTNQSTPLRKQSVCGDMSDSLNTSCSRLSVLCESKTESFSKHINPQSTQVSESRDSGSPVTPVATLQHDQHFNVGGSMHHFEGMVQSHCCGTTNQSEWIPQGSEYFENMGRSSTIDKLAELQKYEESSALEKKLKKPLIERKGSAVASSETFSHSGSKWGKYESVNSDVENEELEDY